MWFFSFSPTGREYRRLAASEKYWRGRVDSLEGEVKTLNKTIFALYDKSFDRFLTGVVKTHAIGDEVKRVVNDTPVPDTHQMDVQTFLNEKEEEYRRQAKEAGKTQADAEFLFNQDRLSLIEQFENQESFY
jgi:hypothetical protein